MQEEEIFLLKRYLLEIFGKQLYSYMNIANLEIARIYRLCMSIKEFSKHEGSYTIRAWFVGRKTYLDDNIPADFIRDRKVDEVLREIDRYMKSGE